MNQIDTSKPWYWICCSLSGTSRWVFNCKEATRNKIEAYITIIYRNYRDRDSFWFIREDMEHPDKNFKQFQCPACKNLMSSKELDSTWDWAGPHCNKCGCTGMEMFAGVQAHAPVMSGREEE